MKISAEPFIYEKKKEKEKEIQANKKECPTISQTM